MKRLLLSIALLATIIGLGNLIMHFATDDNTPQTIEPHSLPFDTIPLPQHQINHTNSNL